MDPTSMRGVQRIEACDEHLRRPWLLRELGAHLDRHRDRIGEVLGLDDADLVDSIGGAKGESVGGALRRWNTRSAAGARREAKERGLSVLCCCSDRYPARLLELASAPAAVHICGDIDRFAGLCDLQSVAIVGCRRPSVYGAAVAESLARSLSNSGVAIVSGMANGIDTEAHRGALAANGPTLAVLAGSADVPYPAANYSLYRLMRERCAILSETAPGTETRRWTFVARNRIIAALASVIVVVEAGARSGSLITAAAAGVLSRSVGAVPGQITNPTAAGTLALLVDGAHMIRGAQDVLDLIYGVGVRRSPTDARPRPTHAQSRILRAIADGHDTPGALARLQPSGARALVELASLELDGRVRRGPGGRLVVTP